LYFYKTKQKSKEYYYSADLKAKGLMNQLLDYWNRCKFYKTEYHQICCTNKQIYCQMLIQPKPKDLKGFKTSEKKEKNSY
jgi:hypothetical protein